jgi:hypothetical protein
VSAIRAEVEGPLEGNELPLLVVKGRHQNAANPPIT